MDVHQDYGSQSWLECSREPLSSVVRQPSPATGVDGRGSAMRRACELLSPVCTPQTAAVVAASMNSLPTPYRNGSAMREAKRNESCTRGSTCSLPFTFARRCTLLNKQLGHSAPCRDRSLGLVSRSSRSRALGHVTPRMTPDQLSCGLTCVHN